LCNFLLDSDNILQAITAQQPFKIGSEAVNAALKSLRNEPVEKKSIVQGTLFSRQKPEEVKDYKAQLLEWTK
jgi:simple sugar transport system substrate-binding protein/ribose transport system substrate-binding protein